MQPNIGTPSYPKERMEKWEKAWLASAIDADGSIFLAHTKGNIQLKVGVFNTNKEFIEFASNLMGVKCQHAKPLKSGKTLYRAIQQGRTTIKIILKQIIPFLIIKKKNAIELMKYIDQHPPQPRSNNFDAWWKLQGIKRGQITLVCKNCGKDFMVWRSQTKKFCCRACYFKWRKAQARKN